jgi:hypothetical protein
MNKTIVKTATDIRCINDLNLFEKLLNQPEIVKTNEWIEKQSKKTPMSTRRHLLSSSVRLTENMAPQVHEMAKDCISKLGVNLPLELYVYSSPQFNAACFKPESERLYVMFSSSLLEKFSPQELKYVMGHELGHHVYKHHDIPIGYLLKGEHKPNPRMVLELFAWSRYAEISADRAGAYCAQNFQAVASALFKLSSGLTSDVVQFDLDDFLAQVDDMQVVDNEPGEGAPQGDWFSTHPFSPLRVKALQFFHQSNLLDKGNPLSKDQLETEVQALMGLMEPSYLEGKTEVAEAMRRLLFSAAVVMIYQNGDVSEEELNVFESFFGKRSLHDGLSVEKLKTSIDGRVKSVNELASKPQRIQLLRDLVMIAKADHQVSELELVFLQQICGSLGVEKHILEHLLDSQHELD